MLLFVQNLEKQKSKDLTGSEPLFVNGIYILFFLLFFSFIFPFPSTGRVVKHWSRLPRASIQLDVVLGSLV